MDLRIFLYKFNMDILNSFMDIQKMIYGYKKRIHDIHT